jgi:hypothetical protein
MVQTHCNSVTLLKTQQLKRSFASVMLVFWVFALGAAWANVCQLENRTTHLDRSFVATQRPAAVWSGHANVLASHAQGQSPSETHCLKVFDDVSLNIDKWQSGMELPDMAVLPPFTMAWSASVTALDALQPARIDPRARTGLPLRTRYVRLAL